MRHTAPLLLALAACNAPHHHPPSTETAAGATTSGPTASAGDGSTYVGFDMLVLDANGEPLPCNDGNVSLAVKVSYDGGATWVPVRQQDTMSICGDQIPPDLSVVLDNSGSQDAVLPAMEAGANDLIDGVLQMGGRASVVRVSTDAWVLSELTDSRQALTDAVAALKVHGGWTALYDGMRVANETIGRVLGRSEAPKYDSLAQFCEDHDRFGEVAFTNGEDNNSAQERMPSQDDDGFDTTPDDVKNLRVNGISTPMHVIGLGPRVHYDDLIDISETSGGRFVSVPDEAGIPDAFAMVRRWLETTTHACVEVPQVACGPAIVDVDYTYGQGDIAIHEHKQLDVNVACPIEPARGATVTLLLTLGDPGISESNAASLVAGAVQNVSRSARPRVLVVRDDNIHDNSPDDPAYVRDLLAAQGADVVLVDEPHDGMAVEDFAGFDVVWMSNPGWPMDDLATFEALRRFSGQGKGVVMQGDDMSWAMGAGFPLTPLTHLDHVSNGESVCGARVEAAHAFTVQTSSGVGVASLPTFSYGDDLDLSTPHGDGEEVLAWGTFDDGADCQIQTPAMVRFIP